MIISKLFIVPSLKEKRERERLKKYVTYITHNLYCTWPIGIWDYHSTHERMVYISCYNNLSLASDKLQFWIEGFDLIFLHNNILEIFILAKKFRIWTLSKCNFKVTLFSACFCYDIFFQAIMMLMIVLLHGLHCSIV